MSSQHSFNATQVTSVYEQFRKAEVDGPAMVKMIGELSQRRARQWTVKPRTDLTVLESVLLRFDDVRSDKVLLDTLELLLIAPWRVNAEEVAATFQGELKEVPLALLLPISGG